MKAFLKLLCIFIVFSVVYSSTNAAGKVYWREYNISAEYDESDEELNIDFSVFSDGNPNEDYVLEVDLGDESCDIDLSYKSFYLTGDCNIDIDFEDALGEYTSEIEAIDEDDISVYDDRETLEVEGLEDDLTWSELEARAEYIQEDEELTLELYLDNVERQPIGDYEITIEIDNKTFEESFSYDADEDEFVADFEIRIDEDDIEDEYDIDYEITDEDEDEEVRDSTLDVDVEIISNEDNFDWSDLDYDYYYDQDDEDIIIEFVLEDITSDPNDDYKIFVELDGEEEDENLRYDEDEEALYATVKFGIDEEDLEDDYEVEFYVENKDSDDKEYDDDFEIEDIGEESEIQDIDWDDLEVSLMYNDEDEELVVEFELELSKAPREDFELSFELDGEDYDEEIKYDNDKESLYAQVEIDIDEDDIENEYEIEYEIVDEDEDEVADETVEIEVQAQTEDTSNIDSDWRDLEVTMQYNESSENMLVSFVLDDVGDDSDDEYDIEFTLNGEDKQAGELKYDEDDSRISNFFYISIDEDDVVEQYSLGIEIENEDGDKVYDGEIIYDLDSGIVEEEEELSTERKQVVEKVLRKYSDNIFKKYFKQDQAIRYIELIIVLFDDYGSKNPEHKKVLDYCIDVFNQILDERR